MRAVTNSSLSGQQSRSGGTRRRKQYFRLGRDTKAVDEFSEGASGSEFPVSYKQLKRSRQIQRVVFLWRKAFARALVGSRLIQATYGMH